MPVLMDVPSAQVVIAALELASALDLGFVRDVRQFDTTAANHFMSTVSFVFACRSRRNSRRFNPLLTPLGMSRST